jgi:hypothetical protein
LREGDGGASFPVSREINREFPSIPVLTAPTWIETLSRSKAYERIPVAAITGKSSAQTGERIGRTGKFGQSPNKLHVKTDPFYFFNLFLQPMSGPKSPSGGDGSQVGNRSLAGKSA